MSGKICEGCKKPVVSGQYIAIEQLIYHGGCFNCAKCGVSCYGKQFAPRGEPGDPNWMIICTKCDFAGGDWGNFFSSVVVFFKVLFKRKLIIRIKEHNKRIRELLQLKLLNRENLANLLLSLCENQVRQRK